MCLPRVAGRAAQSCPGFDREGRSIWCYRPALNTSIAGDLVHRNDKHSKSPGRRRSHSSKSPGLRGPAEAQEAGDSRATSNFFTPGPNDFYLQPGFSGEGRRLRKRAEVLDPFRQNVHNA